SPTANYDPATAVAVTGQSQSTQYGIHAGGSYTQSMTVALPVAPVGSEFLLFVANNNKALDESDTTNNVKARPITTLAPKVDLGIDKPTASATSAVAANGSNLSLSWTITNHGTDLASATRSDNVYLSTKPTYDNSAIFVGSASSFQQPLAGGAGVVESTTGFVPNVKAGSYFLLFVADATHNQYDTDASNNLVTLPLTITRPDVDLSLTAATAPATVSEGSAVTLTYSVKNLGTDAANGGWYDEVYASPTPT
ncbi:CARDB domain-containing protein, partial [Singulisphaera rosea]